MTRPVDWQELYAQNQETIRRAGVAAGSRPSGLAGAATRAPVAAAAKAASRAARGAAPGAGAAQGDHPYQVHLPTRRHDRMPLVVVLHGCTQDAAAIAAGTRWNALADTEGFVVAYPEQSRSGNPNGCWNWFLPAHQRRADGEPAMIAGITREVMAGAGASIDPTRVYLAGMSAGAAMANVVGANYPDVYAALGLHSGLPFAAASSMGAAMTAMRQGVSDVGASARAAHAAMGSRARVLPAMIVHGSADSTVAPVNGDQLVTQWLETNRLAAAGRIGDPSLAMRTTRGRSPGGRSFTDTCWEDRDGKVFLESLRVEGLGHAWSGGSPAGSFTDSTGPDATAAMWRFFSSSRLKTGRQ